MDDLERYIATLPPEVLHQFAWGWNWDSGIDPLHQIIRRADCDKGTALLIYWRAAPGWYTQYADPAAIPAHERDEFDVLVEIEQRYAAGWYVRQEIRFDPTNDNGYDWTTSYHDIPQARAIPAMMFAATPGQTVKQIDFFAEPESEDDDVRVE